MQWRFVSDDNSTHLARSRPAWPAQCVSGLLDGQDLQGQGRQQADKERLAAADSRRQAAAAGVEALLRTDASFRVVWQPSELTPKGLPGRRSLKDVLFGPCGQLEAACLPSYVLRELIRHAQAAESEQGRHKARASWLLVPDSLLGGPGGL